MSLINPSSAEDTAALTAIGRHLVDVAAADEVAVALGVLEKIATMPLGALERNIETDGSGNPLEVGRGNQRIWSTANSIAGDAEVLGAVIRRALRVARESEDQ